jgi:dephospho-CoA kinase
VSKEVAKMPSTIADIKKHFGENVFDENGELNREKLGDIVFKNQEKRQVLNRIFKWKVMWGLFKRFYTLKIKEKAPFVIMDIPLLFESGFFQYILYPIILVSTPDETAVV